MEFNELNLEPEPSYLADMEADEDYLSAFFATPTYLDDIDPRAVEWFLTHKKEV